ncbi:MAG: DegT/DnrJ/EryC1/StrS family aminotransferase [Acidobacteriota bacterium]|nr:DegT/DnrJ/EryC1/StrS family aminotransferase [Acidobacteriota bacterium]MDH3530088.1 DegT/DnrJ/EryC1/StrS family aminotransferase [Acidobacteriota bacterium]
MVTSLKTVEKLMTLPSDQDASGRTLGAEELANLGEVIASGTLSTTKGTFGKRLEEAFAGRIGVAHAYALTSGSAAIHVAIGAVNPNPGDEIITTSVTDMGALSPIVYQGAVPVFAEVDPQTLNVTASTIEEKISDRTKAIIVTHLFGNPCEMNEIMELARSHGIPVIEDAAQSFLASVECDFVGAIGDIGCFSFQQGKHMTTGEGGIVTSNDEELARRMFLHINKAWGYGDQNPDHYFLALNYRMSELQAAVAMAQLEKLDECVETRIENANRLSELVGDIDGIETPRVADNARHVYWRYCLNIDDTKIRDGGVGMAAVLKEKNIFTAPRYIQKPSFMCQVFQEKNTFGDSGFPFNLARPEAIDYRAEAYPMTVKGLNDILVLPWNEMFTDEHVEYIAKHVRRAAKMLRIS